MKTIKLIKKDLKLFRRDHKALILTIIIPILILFILGNVFSQTTTSISGLKLGLCDLDKESKPLNIPLFQIEKLEGSCDTKARNLVESGDLRAAIIIPENFTKDIREGYGSEIILYIDNSKTQTAIFASDAIKALVQDLNERVGTEFIQNAWDNLKNLNENLKIVVNNLGIAKEQAEEIQNRVNELSSEISQINTTELDQQLNSLNSSLTNLSSFNITISQQINDEITELRNLYNESCPGELSETQCSIINNSINNLTLINNNISARETEINNLLNNTNVTRLSEQVELLREARDNITLELIKVNETINNYTSNIINIINELNETTQLLDTYTSRDPRNIVRAVTLNEEKVFGDKTYFEFLVPGLILIILLFTILLITSSNIVYERNTGTLARTILSPTSIPLIIICKTLFFIIVCAIELLAMFITIKLMGIDLTLNLSIIFMLLLASINFIVLGLLLGSLSNSENTALLSSLVIALPMFFLSNLFFPFEIIPKFMKEIGSNLPLTLSIEGLDKIITYSSTLESIIIIKLILIPIVLGILTYIIIKKKPTSG